jgi:predicted kinase
MTTAHLLHGLVGAGKTTLARKMERELGAVRFTYDEWMVRLYGSNPPASEFPEFYARIEDLIWDLAVKLLSAGVDVIIDCGFWSRASRDSARDRVRQAGAQPVFYKVNCPEETMRSRVAARTKDLPGDSLWINQAAFDEFKDRFQQMEEDEDFLLVDNAIEQGAQSDAFGAG